MEFKYRIRQHLKDNSLQYMLVLGIFIFGLMLGFLNVKGLIMRFNNTRSSSWMITCGEAWKENYWVWNILAAALSSRQKPF